MSSSSDASVPGALPRHVAIVMDGNGRWANKRFMPRIVGHKFGVDALVRTVRACADRGIEHLTVFAFSSENWKRPEDEVSGLMGLVLVAVSKFLGRLEAEGVRIRIVGDRAAVSDKVRAAWDEAEGRTAHNTRITLSVAFNYGGRWDVVQACRQAVAAGLKPEARYIVVQRDVADNARSIIRAEREGRGPAPDANQWWSVRPRLAPQWQHRGVVERAVAQVIGVHADIGRDSAALGPDRFLTVRHEDLCARPEAVMAEVAAFLARTGGAPADRHPLPDRFGGGGSRRLDDADEALIAATMAELGHG